MTLKTYTPEQLKEILALHGKWWRGEGGERANLGYADLRIAPTVAELQVSAFGLLDRMIAVGKAVPVHA